MLTNPFYYDSIIFVQRDDRRFATYVVKTFRLNNINVNGFII